MTHGGSRKGAGRKPSVETETFVRVSFRLPPDCAEWLKRKGRKQGQVVAALIRESMKKE